MDIPGGNGQMDQGDRDEMPEHLLHLESGRQGVAREAPDHFPLSSMESYKKKINKRKIGILVGTLPNSWRCWGRVGRAVSMSSYSGWLRKQFQYSTSTTVWQHVKWPTGDPSLRNFCLLLGR